MKYITSLALLLIASVGMAQGVPNTFTSGTPALAAEVNENFSDLDTRVNSASAAAAQAITDITVEETEIVEMEFLAQSYCPPDTIAISANCACVSDGVSANFGLLSLCASGVDDVGQGAAAICDIDFTYDPGLPLPTAAASAMCVGLTYADGSQASTIAMSPKGDYQKSMGAPSGLKLQLQAAQERSVARRAKALSKL